MDASIITRQKKCSPSQNLSADDLVKPLQTHEDYLPKQSSTSTQRYNSKARIIISGLIVSLSGVIFGYGLSAISVVSMKELILIYNMNLDQDMAHAILIGIMPVGGIFGAAFNQLFLKYFSRKQSIYIMTFILWLGLSLMLIHNPVTIIAGRFIEGVAIGLYVSISPIFLQEITPKELRPQVMPIFGLCKGFGVVLAYSLENLFIEIQFVENSYIVLLTFNGYLAVIQVILLYFLIPQSPLELVQKNQIGKATKAILAIYQKQYLQIVLYQLREDCQTAKNTIKVSRNVQDSKLMGVKDELRKKQLRTAFLIGTHIIILRQFIGQNCVVTFSGQIISHFDPSIAVYMALILNLIAFIFNLLSAIFITKRFGRRSILIVGTLGMGIISIVIAVGLAKQVEWLILNSMSIFMAFAGGSILTVGWSYPSQVLTPHETMVPNILGWISLSMTTSLPPLVVGAMPDGNAYPLFLFFGVYGIAAYVVLQLWMRETKNLTYKEIIESF